MQFSIITVCFNSAATIRETFESVLHQDFKDYEYLVIDGASTDGTLEIIKEYEPKFEGRMRWISEKDSGIYDAMNKGIRMACGEIIGIINSDDFYEQDALSNVLSAFHAQPDADVYYGIQRVINDAGSEIFSDRLHHERLFEGMIPHPASFVKKTAYQKYGVFDEQYRIAADYDLMCRYFVQGAKFYPIDRILVNFRITGVSNKQTKLSYREFDQVRVKYKLVSRNRTLKEAFIRKTDLFLDHLFHIVNVLFFKKN